MLEDSIVWVVTQKGYSNLNILGGRGYPVADANTTFVFILKIPRFEYKAPFRGISKISAVTPLKLCTVK